MVKYYLSYSVSTLEGVIILALGLISIQISHYQWVRISVGSKALPLEMQRHLVQGWANYARWTFLYTQWTLSVFFVLLRISLTCHKSLLLEKHAVW